MGVRLSVFYFLTLLMLLSCGKAELDGTLGSASEFCPLGTTTNSNSLNLNFADTNDFVNLGVDPSVIFGNSVNNMSISFWAKKGNSSVSGAILTSFYHTLNGGIYIYFSDSTSIGFTYFDGASHDVNITLADTTIWHHYVFTYNVGTLRVYIDGVLVVTDTSLPVSFDMTLSNGVTARFGNLPLVSSDEVFMDDVAFFSSTLASSEVSTIYNAGNPFNLTSDACSYVSSSNLLGFWDMNSSSSYPTVFDLSTYGRNGTITSSPSTAYSSDLY